jgi:hypothetical protein
VKDGLADANCNTLSARSNGRHRHRRRAPAKGETLLERRRHRKIEHPPCQLLRQAAVDDQYRDVVAANDRVASVWHVDGHGQAALGVQSQPHTLLWTGEVFAQESAQLGARSLGNLNHVTIPLRALTSCTQRTALKRQAHLFDPEYAVGGSQTGRPAPSQKASKGQGPRFFGTCCLLPGDYNK